MQRSSYRVRNNTFNLYPWQEDEPRLFVGDPLAQRLMMRSLARLLIACWLWAACGSSPSAPSPSSPGLTPSPTPTPTPTPAPTPSPLPTPVPVRGFTVSGMITDGFDGSPLSSVRVEGWDANRLSVTTLTDGRGHYSISNVIEGMSFSRSGFATEGFFIDFSRDSTLNWILPRACAVGLQGGQLIVFVGADYVDFKWPAPTERADRPATVQDYLLEIGSSSSLLGYYRSPDVLATFTGGAPFYKRKTPSVSPGLYWARVRMKNDCGLSMPNFGDTSFRLP